MWLMYFIYQFLYVGLLGLQSKLNRDHKVLAMFLVSMVISFIQIEVMDSVAQKGGAEGWEKVAFILGGAFGITALTSLYERWKK